jgi:DNA-binding NarL/FixJ family response regulator
MQPGRSLVKSRRSGQRNVCRKAEVLRHVARGLSNAEIARALTVGEGTVKTHVAPMSTLS